jgi:ParB/RepB/Spo0J family partition protein
MDMQTNKAPDFVASAELLKLQATDLAPSPNNPRLLFDPEPLKDLKENIRAHGVLVPLTVFRLPDGKRYGILDGARRHLCCTQLKDEGFIVEIPCNVVAPPNPLAGLLYMFNIHNFREAWELMPTALSLGYVIKELGENDTKKLSNLTGLSEPQVERCKKLLEVDEDLRELSLDPNPKTRIPSNFWIEADPVIEIAKTELPELFKELGRRGILERFVEKYRQKKIKSVIHFRRISEAFENTIDDQSDREKARQILKGYIKDPSIETRAAFDNFIQDARKVKSTIEACDTFLSTIQKTKIEHITDNRDQVIVALRSAKDFIISLLSQLEGRDDPSLFSENNEDETDGEE